MKRVLLILSLAATTGLAACAADDSSSGAGPGDIASADDNLTAALAEGTYVIDARPFWGSFYASRLSILASKKYEAEIITSDGKTTLLGGSYDILPARPNNPQSPVRTDKPVLDLISDAGDGPTTFEFDKLPNGALKLYHSARTTSFTMKRDPNWQAPVTNVKTIACTGPSVNATLALDQAQNRRGTLTITRNPSANDAEHDPPAATVTMTKNERGGSPAYVYFDGMSGEQEYYANMLKADFDRGTGPVTLHLMWAEHGQEWDVGVTCAFQ